MESVYSNETRCPRGTLEPFNWRIGMEMGSVGNVVAVWRHMAPEINRFY